MQLGAGSAALLVVLLLWMCRRRHGHGSRVDGIGDGMGDGMADGSSTQGDDDATATAGKRASQRAKRSHGRRRGGGADGEETRGVRAVAAEEAEEAEAADEEAAAQGQGVLAGWTSSTSRAAASRQTAGQKANGGGRRVRGERGHEGKAAKLAGKRRGAGARDEHSEREACIHAAGCDLDLDL